MCKLKIHVYNVFYKKTAEVKNGNVTYGLRDELTCVTTGATKTAVS